MIKITYTSSHIATLSSTHKIKLHDIPWLFLSKVTIKDECYEKKERRRRNKRCIPKEGMSHAQKACQKKKKNNKDAYPKKVCHMPTWHSKKREEKDSPHPTKIKKREGSCKGVHPPKKIPHICTSWSDCMTSFCLDLVFDLATEEKQACLPTPPLSSS